MTRFRKVALSVLALLALAGALAWRFQDEIVLAAIGLAADRALAVGPNVPIVWETGADPAGRAPGERPPNIVIILADDLGWNDSASRRRRGGRRVPTPNIDSIARDGVHFPRLRRQRDLRAVARHRS